MGKLTVTSPLLPDLDEFCAELENIWESKWVTNMGSYHRKLEKELAEYLGVPYISLFSNGTLPLLTAFKALEISEGEVITTPFTFVATANAILWSGLKPVFVDVDPLTGTIDPEKIEAAVTEHTRAVLAVHVYGNPCDCGRIQKVADKYGLKVIYDAAHAFGVKKNGRSVLLDGDLSTLSFHATKVFNTLEGGAMVMHDEQMKRKIEDLRNFGFRGQLSVVSAGINSKMDEVRCAFGLLNLKRVDSAISARRCIADWYRGALADVPGISCISELDGVSQNYGYFPIFVDESKYGISRDTLFDKLVSEEIMVRRYFYPLVSDFQAYGNLPSSDPAGLLNAKALSDAVICLPIYPGLTDEDFRRVVDVIRK